jgi:hypothetical protein
MQKTKQMILTIALLGLLAGPTQLCAQLKAAPVNASAAPVPAPILNGKRAFISFELGDVSSFPSVYSGGPERAYKEFYTAMQQWGRYQLVADPRDADVIFAIRFVDSPGLSFPQFRLGINAPQSNVALWGFSEEINGAFRKKSRDAAFSDAITQLVRDVQQLTTQP